jgi:hypothetical protein
MRKTVRIGRAHPYMGVLKPAQGAFASNACSGENSGACGAKKLSLTFTNLNEAQLLKIS